jgi:hypothetical protein
MKQIYTLSFALLLALLHLPKRRLLILLLPGMAIGELHQTGALIREPQDGDSIIISRWPGHRGRQPYNLKNVYIKVIGK